MKTRIRFVALPVLALTFLSASALPNLGGSTTSSTSRSEETARIKKHLSRVEKELSRKDTSAFSEGQRRGRAAQLARLRAYCHAGKFPHNHDFPNERRPYFMDRHGTLCAMAYLIDASGRHDIVELVASTANNATVCELAANPVIGPALATWLRDAGLTVEEAQRIQPAYGEIMVAESDPEIRTGFAVGSVAAGSINLVSVGMNSSLAQTRGARSWISIVGLGSGLLGVGLGVANVDAGGPRRALALVDMTLGAASLLASTWALIQTHPTEPRASLTPGAELAVLPTARFDQMGRPMVGLRAKF